MIPIPITSDSPSNARIGYSSLLVSSDISAAEVTLVPNTYDRYAPASGAVTTKFQLGAASTIDYIAIAAHNFGNHIAGGVPFTVSTAATVSGALTERGSFHPVANAAIMLIFDPLEVAEIAITHNTTAGLEYGVVYCGESLQMERPIYGGHEPINLSRKTKYQSVMSETGQFLGRNITRQGTETAFSWRNLTPDWYRNNFDPFVQSARTLPFFIKWRPDLFENAAFGHTTGDISPTNQGVGTQLMSVRLNIRAHDDI